jgi:endonuclease/exonuclease/phosphatase (EEP) superfamily protein YafD
VPRADRAARWARAAFGAIALGSLGGLLSPWLSRSLAGRGDAVAWAVDLAAHWQWLFLALLVAAILAAVALGRRQWALLLLAAPLPWLSASPPLGSVAKTAAADRTFTIASANVFYRNHDPARLRSWLEQVRPDVVVIVEISHRLGRAIEGADWRDYPYRHVSPAADAFGVAVLSRHPLDAATVWRDREGVGVLVARIAWQNRPVSLAAFHPVPPQTVRHHRERNRVLDCLTPGPSEPGGPRLGGAALVAGDFNATPWSDAFAGPSGRGWRRATGLAPTWPVAWRGLMGIPIDHVLASDGWRLLEAAVGPDVGSDHRPVMVRLQADPDATAPGGSPARADLDPMAAVTSCLSREPASARSGA